MSIYATQRNQCFGKMGVGIDVQRFSHLGFLDIFQIARICK